MSKNKISNGLSELKTDKVEFNKSSVFEITIPHEFGLGKNEIKINLTSNSVKKGSEVLIDINDVTGNPIYYEISPIANVDKSRSIIVEIDEETIEGKTTFILVSTLNSSLTYKCILEIPIVKGIKSNSEIKFESEPEVVYKERSLPTQQFSSISRLINRTFSGGTISSQGSISPKQLEIDKLTIERPELASNVKSNKISNNVGSSSIQKIPTEFNLSTITAKNLAFSSSMKGGTILIKNINLEVPKDASSTTPFLLQDYSASIVEVNNTGSIQVYPPFNRQIEYITKNGNKKVQTYNKFINESNFTASFYDNLTLTQTQFTQSYAVLDLYDLETVSGQVDKIEVSYKSLNDIGTDYQPIGKFEIRTPNLLVDSASLFFDNENGITENPIGNFRNGLIDFESNWISSSKGSFPITSSVSRKVKDGIKIQQNPLNTGSGEFSLFRPKQYHSLNVKSDNEFELNGDFVFERDSNLEPQLDVYISGSFVKQNKISNSIPFVPLQSSSFGQYIGSFNRKITPITFKTEKDGDIRPIFVQRTGIWHIGNIEINSKNQSRVFVPMNINSGSEISLKIDYLNKNNKKSRYSTYLDKIYFTGSKFPIGSSTTIPDGTVSGSDQLTGSFDNRYERKGTGILSSSAQIATDISGAFTNNSASFALRIDNINDATSSFLNNSFTSSYNNASGSWNNRLQSLEQASGSLNQFSGSTNARLDQLEIKTGSYATTGSNQFNGNQSVSGSITVSTNLITDTGTGSFSGSFHGQYSSSQQVDYNQIQNKLNLNDPGQYRILTSTGDVSSSQANKSVTYVSSSDVDRFRLTDMVEYERGISSSFWSSEISYVTQSFHQFGVGSNLIYVSFPIYRDSNNFNVASASTHNASYAIRIETQIYGLTGSLSNPKNNYMWASTNEVKSIMAPFLSSTPVYSGLVTVNDSVNSYGSFGQTFSGRVNLSSWFATHTVFFDAPDSISIRYAMSPTGSGATLWSFYLISSCRVLKNEISNT